MKTSEAKWKREFVKEVEKRGDRAVHLASSNMLGFPDLAIFLAGISKSPLFIECKKKGGVLRAHQVKAIELLTNKYGQQVCVAFSFADALIKYEEYKRQAR